MKIVQVTAEFAPIAKAGGLGEVLVGLSRELVRQGDEVEVILPKYDFLHFDKISQVTKNVYITEYQGCRLHLIDSPEHFHGGKIYGAEDLIGRFLYFSRAALEYLEERGEPIDILHLHDWHTAFCAPLMRDVFKKRVSVKGILLTIHNGEYQGQCSPADLDAIGVQGEHYLTPERLQDDDPKTPEMINLLKGGIVYSDAVNTVSPTYAQEILTPEMGFHLDATCRKYRSKLSGILNGIDQNLWNPKVDPALLAHYDGESSLETILKAKAKNKRVLHERFHLDLKKGPWIGGVTRIVSQKGPELLKETLKETVEKGGVFILLGSAPQEPKLRAEFYALKAEYAGHPQVLLHFEYDETLAHEIYAALDFLIVPSLFEPCGLTQLIAMHYGTVPIVRATGGLKDTVFDCEDPTVPASKRNGFTFPGATAASLRSALDRAFHLFHTDPVTFQILIRRGMQLDFSWKKPAQVYKKLYVKIQSIPTKNI